MSSVRSEDWLNVDNDLELASVWDDEEGHPRPTVVAEILSDGTVQILDRASAAQEITPWGSGVIGGDGWTLWWERRRWS